MPQTLRLRLYPTTDIPERKLLHPASDVFPEIHSGPVPKPLPTAGTVPVQKQ